MQASLTSLLHAPTFTSFFNSQMTGICTICCCISLAGHMHLIHVQLAIWILANHKVLPAGDSLPATPFQRTSALLPALCPPPRSRHGHLSGHRYSIDRIRSSAPPPSRTSTMAPAAAVAIRHACASSPGDDATASRLISYLFLLSPPPSLMYLHLLHQQQRGSNLQTITERNFFFSLLLSSSLCFSSTISPG